MISFQTNDARNFADVMFDEVAVLTDRAGIPTGQTDPLMNQGESEDDGSQENELHFVWSEERTRV